jgi:hypothetical protein
MHLLVGRLAAGGRTTTRAWGTVTGPRAHARHATSWASWAISAFGPGRCREALGQSQPNTVRQFLVFHFFLLEFQKFI